MKKVILLFPLILAGCGGIEHDRKIAQQQSTQLIAGIGDNILSVQETRSMPNAFGKADLFGRTVPAGNTSIQFLGANGSILRFARQSTLIHSNATTMNSSPMYIPSQRSSNSFIAANNNFVVGTSSNNYRPGYFVPPSGSQETLQNQGAVQFEIDTKKEMFFFALGHRVNILNFNVTSISYSIEKTQ